MGPMTAGARFLDEILHGDWPRPSGAKVAQARRQPARLARLHRYRPWHRSGRYSRPCRARRRRQSIPTRRKPRSAQIAADKTVTPARSSNLCLRSGLDLVLDKKTPLPGHANGMQFYAYDAARLLLKRVYYSIGGGFVVSDEELQRMKARGPEKPCKRCRIPLPMPRRCWPWRRRSGLSIADMKRANEEIFMSREELDDGPRSHLGGDARLHRARA